MSFILLAGLPTQAKSPRHARRAMAVDSAVIVNSGSAGFPGYRIRVMANGRLASVTLMPGGRTSGGRTGRLTLPVARRFFTDLTQAGPVNALPTQPQSATPGVRIYVQYRGQLSPNLRQAGSNAGATLYQDAKQIIEALRLPIPDSP